MGMEDTNTSTARGHSSAQEYDAAIAVKLMAGWVLTGEDCEVCVTQLISNRPTQAFCVACSLWKDTEVQAATNSSEIADLKKKVEPTTTLLDTDKTSSLKVIKSVPGHVESVGKKSKDVDGETRSPRKPSFCDYGRHDSAKLRMGLNSISTIHQKFFCAVPPIVDDESGPIEASLWEEGYKPKRTVSRQNSDGSPRTVLEGPDSSGWSEGSSRKSLYGDEGTDFTGMVHANQKLCIQGLWRSFATKKWQTFPTGIWKKELSISDPVLLSSSGAHGEEISHSEQDCVDDLLGFSPNARRSWQQFSYEDVAFATNNFDPENLVGKGGYAQVFKGVLKNGQLVAVKKHSRADIGAEKERDFLIELGIVSHVSHTNVAKLLGICIEYGLHLVFQFSPLGSLQHLLHSPANSPVFSWEARMKVAVGVARGLHYLHEQCQRRIIHRDIKASNILLDSDFEPQISDFGLSKWLPDRWTHHTVSPIEGTFGYLSPEYFMYGIVDEKTDVFAYGVLLLELITGRKPVDSEKQNLVAWAKPYLNKGDLKQLADRRLDGGFDANQMECIVMIAGLCVRPTAACRPTMSEVVQFFSEEAVDKKSEHLARLCSISLDFEESDTESLAKYGVTDDYETDMERHRALAMEF